MYSELPLKKEHDVTDSPDTESLLSVDLAQEKLLHALPSTTSRRNRRIKTYLHIAAIIFYTVITVILYTWSTRLHAKSGDIDKSVIYCEYKCILYRQQLGNLKLIRGISSGKNSHNI